ncbi:MAG: GAF domain-containing sensor histidine kinase [Actinomycetota bacterium]|nr:GAF domain-containing sensor histidine kinase [Actinomycetota bacterium]
MAAPKHLGDSGTTQDIARAAGIGSRRPLRQSDIDRRRTQLWLIALFVFVAFAGTIGLYGVAYDLLPPALRLGNVSSYVVVVLIGGLILAFLLYVGDKEARLRRLSAMLVEERVLSAALSNRLSEISALSEVGKALNTTLDLTDVLNLILSSALELLGATEGSIMLLEEDKEHLQVVSYQGPQVEMVMQGRGEVGRGIAGTVAESRKPMLIQEDRVDPSLKDSTHPERKIRSAMCVPLVRRDELLGVLNVNETEGARIYTEQDLNALGLFAEQAAIAIGNASLFEKEHETVTRLQELDQLRSDFVASVSHELKTPLTAIIGAAKTVTRKGATMGPDQHDAFLEMIERQGNRLLKLVEDVLTTAQIESGRPKMTRELLDLRSLVAGVREELLAVKVGAGREIVVECAPATPRAWGDPTALHHIISNLVENALKYSDGTRVVVRVTETPEEARFEVEDEGPGISQEKLDHIFERFRQVDSSSTRRVGGFGLGLFIVRNLVDAHGGEIDVKSTPGIGSTFTVRLPKRSSDRGGLLSENP